MDFKIKLAEVIIAIHSMYHQVYDMCKEYLCEGKESFAVSICDNDILFEREKSRREAAYEGIPYQPFPKEYLETLAVYRRIVTELLRFNVMLMHGSAVCVDGKAYLFTASSGVGKTTHTKLWLEHIQGSFVINGDKPLIRFTDSGPVIYGTPWSGKEQMNRNASAPLCAICIVNRGTINTIQKIDFQTALPIIIQQSYRPHDAGMMTKTLELIRQLGEKVNLYDLHCTMDPEAAYVAYEGMKS